MAVHFRDKKQMLSLAASSAAMTVAMLTSIGVAQAQDFCANLNDLIDQSRSQFVEIMVEPSSGSGNHDTTLALTGASYCAVTKRSKQSFYSCGWEFSHRAKQAYDTFDEFVREVDDCVGQQAALHTDQSVNHPDYYDLRLYETQHAEVSVSVKDKSALNKTLVFIRVEGGKNN